MGPRSIPKRKYSTLVLQRPEHSNNVGQFCEMCHIMPRAQDNCPKTSPRKAEEAERWEPRERRSEEERGAKRKEENRREAGKLRLDWHGSR